MLCMNRREFLASATAFVSVPMASGASGKALPADFRWAFLVHFGMNMWNDIDDPPKRDFVQYVHLTDEEFAEMSAPGYGHFYSCCDFVRFDENLWRRLADRLKAEGCNTVLIDLGEFVRYPSHPELAVKGSWEPERLAAEVRRLKAMGFEVVPKLNFSTCHDLWLKEYAKMISTRQYYQVVKDLIGDVCEMFERPKFFHLGLDEEDVPSYQDLKRVAVFRHGDQWWHDVLFMIEEVERHDARAWMWSDYVFHHATEEFIRRMPKSVVQNPWTYGCGAGSLFSEDRLKKAAELGRAGFDVIPCGSNCFGSVGNFGALAEYCRENIPAERFKGLMMAPWAQTRQPFERVLCQAIDIMGAKVRDWTIGDSAGKDA